MALEIRQVRPDELPEVGRLTSEVYIADGLVGRDDGYAQELLETARRAADAEVWVAVEDGRVLGSVTFCPVGSTYREIGRNDEGELRMLAVDHAARGRGLGTSLVELCVQRARELGYAGVRLSSMDLMTSAHRIYHRLGFTRAPDDDWSPVPGVTLLVYEMAFAADG